MAYAKSERLSVQERALVFALSPIVEYLQQSTSVSTVKGWPTAELGDKVYKVFLAAVQRTRILKKFRRVLESESPGRTLGSDCARWPSATRRLRQQPRPLTLSRWSGSLQSTSVCLGGRTDN